MKKIIISLSILLIVSLVVWFTITDQKTDDYTGKTIDDEEENKTLNTQLADSVELSEEEVYELLDSYRSTVDSHIMFAYQEGINSNNYNEEYRPLINTFELEIDWIANNFEFKEEYHNQLLNDVINLANSHKNGDNEALFSLKEVLHELNTVYNPDKIKEVRATDVSLSDAEKIRNNENPVSITKEEEPTIKYEH